MVCARVPFVALQGPGPSVFAVTLSLGYLPPPLPPVSSAGLVLQPIHICIAQRPGGGTAAARGRLLAGPLASRPRPDLQ